MDDEVHERRIDQEKASAGLAGNPLIVTVRRDVPSRHRAIAAMLKRRNAETPKRRNAETPKRRNAETPKRRNAETPKRRNAQTPKRSTPNAQRRNAKRQTPNAKRAKRGLAAMQSLRAWFILTSQTTLDAHCIHAF
ncbi:hypothetical protein [Paraburkholderia kirstenboschensis]|uniref:hypothetical protein n=1 Tax=Paraburkholderia kirstenboschensis TaxID=1245436 RepID=UPI001918283E|nr:hypothetical protein [Paraburkholderia kirstenboschensis]